MYESTIELFDDYYRKLDAAGVAGFNRDLACEVRERLEQLGFILDRVKELLEAAEISFARSQEAIDRHIAHLQSEAIPFENVPAPEAVKLTSDEVEQHKRATFESKLLTECFYYLGSRVRSLLRHKSAPIPGLQDFECENVRNVRNKLLEHPEGRDSQVFIPSWAYGAKSGPVLKAVRYAGQEHVFPDHGLFPNAEEFFSNLDRLLRSRLNEGSA